MSLNSALSGPSALSLSPTEIVIQQLREIYANSDKVNTEILTEVKTLSSSLMSLIQAIQTMLEGSEGENVAVNEGEVTENTGEGEPVNEGNQGYNNQGYNNQGYNNQGYNQGGGATRRRRAAGKKHSRKAVH